MKTLAAAALFLSGTTALAQTATPTPATPALAPAADSGGGAPADPEGRSGMFQLMLQTPPVAVETSSGIVNRGFGFQHLPGGTNAGYIGISGGLGYNFTSMFEAGGALGFTYYGGGNIVTFLAEPFGKLNFGPTLKLGAFNPFALVGIGFGLASSSNGFGGSSTSGLFAFDIDPGIEWLFGGHWGVDAYIPIQVALYTNGGDAQLEFGVAYGFVGYF